MPTFDFGASDRGKVEQVNLQIVLPVSDVDGNGLPDDWERRYFGTIGVNPGADPDHDGMSNLAEYIAATDPTDGQPETQSTWASSRRPPFLFEREHHARAKGTEGTVPAHVQVER